MNSVMELALIFGVCLVGIGIAELLVVSVAVCAARIAFGRCSRSRL